MLSRMLTPLTDLLDRRVGWQKLPKPFGMFALWGLRSRLRELNLHDTGSSAPKSGRPEAARAPMNLRARTIDGSYNDLDDPAMGSIGCRFGRNVPLMHTEPEPDPHILHPSPRLISRRLLARNEFIPATTLNVLAAAWLQFEVHDWFSHGKHEEQNPWKIDIAEDDEWWQRPM